MVAQVSGGGWGIADFSHDDRRAAVIEFRQVTNSNLYMLDLASGAMTPIGDPNRDIAYGGAQFARDGTLWVTSDEGSDFQRLGRIDPATGALHAGGHRHQLGRRRASTSPTTAASSPSSPTRPGSAASPARHANSPCSPGRIDSGGHDRRSRDRALGRDRLQPRVGPQRDRRLFGRSADARAHPLDPERDRRARPRAQRRARADRGPELRRRAGLGLPLPARSGPLSWPPAADRQHPWRPGEPVAPGLPGPQQLSDQRARHRASSTPTCAARPAMGKRFVEPRQRPGPSREQRSRHRRLPRPAASAILRSTGPASRSPAAPMAAICATPRRSTTAIACAPPIAWSPSRTS